MSEYDVITEKRRANYCCMPTDGLIGHRFELVHQRNTHNDIIVYKSFTYDCVVVYGLSNGEIEISSRDFDLRLRAFD